MNLLKWKLILLWRSFSSTETKRLGTLLAASFALVWSILAFAGVRSLFSLGEPWTARSGAGFAGEVLAGLYLASLAVSLFVACGSAFVVMYSSSDLELLFAAPLGVRQVFFVKFLEVLPSVMVPIFFLTIPVMLGYGAGVGAGWQYYPAVLLLAGSVLLWPTALGMVLNLIIMRLIPPYQVREMGVVLGSLAGGLIYALLQFAGRGNSLFEPSQLARVAGSINIAQGSVSPIWWLAQATLAASRGNWSGFFCWTGLVTVSALVFFALSLFLVQEAFYGGWAGSGEVRRRKRGRRIWEGGGASFLPSSVVLAIAGKEMKMIIRDPREWSQPIYMLVVFCGAFLAPLLGREKPLPEPGVLLSLLFFSGFMLVALLSSAWALGSVSREGRGWAVLRSSPLTGRQILWGKMMGITPLVLAVGLAVVFILTRFAGKEYFLIMAGYLLLLTPGLVALNVAIGTAAPKFDALDPGKRISVSAVFLSMFLELIYGGVVALAVILGAADLWLGVPSLSGLMGFLLLAATAAATVLLSLAIGQGRIDNNDFGCK